MAFNVQVLPGNELYRVNDIVSGDLKYLVKAIDSDPAYKHTLMGKYCAWRKSNLSEKKTKKTRINKFAKICINYMKQYKFDLPDQDCIVIHVRAGDDWKHRGLGNPNCIKHIYDQVNKIRDSHKIKNIVIVTALHYGISQKSIHYPNLAYRYTESSCEINKQLLVKLAKSLPLPVTIRSSKNIDSDFLFMASARHLVLTRGGYGALANHVNSRFHSTFKNREFNGTQTMPDMDFTKILVKQ